MPTVRGLNVSVEIRVSATVYSFHALINTKISAVTIPGAATGSKDFDQRLNTVAAIDGGRLFHFSGDTYKSTAQQPDGKCLVKCGINKDQPQ